MKKDRKKKKDIDEYADLTVANMNVEGMPWYKSPESKKRAGDMNSLNLSRAERRAMIKGAFAAMLPAFLIGLAVFCAAFGLLMLYFYLVS